MRGANRGNGEVTKVVRGEVSPLREGSVSLVTGDDLNAFWKVHRYDLLMHSERRHRVGKQEGNDDVPESDTKRRSTWTTSLSTEKGTTNPNRRAHTQS